MLIRKPAPVNLIVHYPATSRDSAWLAQQVADVHAAAVYQHLQSLNCPAGQKLELLEAVIQTAKENSRDQA